MALPAPGPHNIQTNTERFLSLGNPNDAVALVDVAVNDNQIWDFQYDGGNCTIRNVGQNAFARCNFAGNGQIVGGEVPMNWILIADGGGYSIRLADNHNFRWNVNVFNGGGVSLLGMPGNLVIQNVHRFNIL